MKKQKSKSTDLHGNVTKTTVKGNKKKEVTRVKREYASNAKPLAENPTVKRKGKKRYVKKTTYASSAQPLSENPTYKVKTKGTSPIKMKDMKKAGKRKDGASMNVPVDLKVNGNPVGNEEQNNDGASGLLSAIGLFGAIKKRNQGKSGEDLRNRKRP